MAIADGDLKRQQIGFAHGALIELHVQDVAPGFLVVEGVVLDVAHHLLGLQAFHELPDHGSGEDGILAGVLEIASVARLANQVYAAADGHVVALIAQFAADHRAVEISRLGVETGRRSQGRRQQRGIAALSGSHADAHRRIGHIDGWNAEPIDAGNEARAFVGSGRDRIAGTQRAPAGSMHQLDLFVERHLPDEHVGAFIGREGFIQPRPFHLGRLGGLRENGGSGQRQKYDGKFGNSHRGPRLL